MSQKFNDVLKYLEKYEVGGKRELQNGTKLICHVPHIAPEAWLHIIYNKLSNQQIVELEKKSITGSFPEVFKEFLRYTNGINIFSDSLSIWGLRTTYARTGDEAIQPYDLIELNKERTKKTPSTWLYFGSYSWDGSIVLFDLNENSKTNKVYLCERRTDNLLKEWPDFWSWFTSEVERLGGLFSINGIEKDVNFPTSPT